MLPILGVLAGVHHIADRSSGGGIAYWAGDSPLRGISLDQGTFLDAGVVGISPVHLALAIEDNHISNAGSKATIVTLSAQAAFRKGRLAGRRGRPEAGLTARSGSTCTGA